MKKILFVLFVLSIMVLVGCGQQAVQQEQQQLYQEPASPVKEITKTTVPEKPVYTFELKNAEMKYRVSDDGEENILALEFSYDTNVLNDLHMELIYPDGRKYGGSKWVKPSGFDWIQIYAQMGGDYQLIVYNSRSYDAEGKEEILLNKTFTYAGPKVTVTSAVVSGWDPNYVMGWEPSEFLVTLKNTGDMPLRTGYQTVVYDYDGKPSTSFTHAIGELHYTNPEDNFQTPGYGWINPGEKTYKVKLYWFLSTGTHNMEIVLLILGGKEIYRFPFTITTPTPPVK